MSNKIILNWPQWQGAGPAVVSHLAPELKEDAQHGYLYGNAVLRALIGNNQFKFVSVPVQTQISGVETQDGVYARDIILAQLKEALSLIEAENPDFILTIGGECSVSVAPFAYFEAKYPNDLAIVWIDAHPDITLPGDEYNGYHAMAISHLTGVGDQAILDLLPAKVSAEKIAVAGLVEWTSDEEENFNKISISRFSAEDISHNPHKIQEWIHSTGTTKVAIHFDVDSITSRNTVFGLGPVQEAAEASAILSLVNLLSSQNKIVALTIAEFIPRQVIQLRQILKQIDLVPIRSVEELANEID